MIKTILEKVNPTYLFHAIYALIFAIWIIDIYIDNKIIAYVFQVSLFVVSVLFLYNIVSLLFTPDNIMKIRIDLWRNKPEKAIDFLISEDEKWLKDVLKFLEKLQSNIKSKNIKDEKLERNLQQERNLQLIFSKISESIHADNEAIEKLIGISVDIDPRIVKEIINDYDSIKEDNIVNNTRLDNINMVINRRITRFNYKHNRLLKLKEIRLKLKKREKEDIISDIINVIRDPSTGRAVTMSAKVLQKADNVEEMMWLIRFVNSRTGFTMAELLGLKVEFRSVKWYDRHVRDQMGQMVVSFDKVKKFLKEFKDKRESAKNKIWENFENWDWIDIRRDILDARQQILAIALTFGYSSVLEFILDKMARELGSDAKRMQLILIKSEQKFGDEEFLRAELMGRHPGLNCSIMPLDAIKERGLQIGKVFVGIESIDVTGDIVHPRGGVEAVKNIRDYAPNASFYAFGETYKVKHFKKTFIDYTKLAFCRHENIDYVVTDHGVHRLRKFYLFSWDNISGKEISGKESDKLREFLRKYLNIAWMETAEIKKEDDKIICISANKNLIIEIILSKDMKKVLGEDMKKVILKISGGEDYELIAKEEEGRLNIYKECWELRGDNGLWKLTEKCKINNEEIKQGTLCCCTNHWQRTIMD